MKYFETNDTPYEVLVEKVNVIRLEEALKEIAGQMLSTEWDEETLGDVTEGYDGIIKIARSALEELNS